MKKISKLSILLCIPLIMSCASNIKTIKYTNADLTSFNTFACYASSSSFKAAEFKTESNKPIEQSLISLINANMTVKGFTVNESEPDMLIFLTNSNEINSGSNDQVFEGSSSQGPNFSSSSGNSAGYKRYINNSDSEAKNIPLNNGALIIEIFNRESKELLWIGIAQDFKAHLSDQTLLTRMVNGVFEKFPNK